MFSLSCNKVAHAKSCLSLIQKMSVKNLVGADVHGKGVKVDYTNMPLFRREGKDKKFKTGDEAVELLLGESRRRDPKSEFFRNSLKVSLHWVKELFVKDKKYAFAMKHLIEPERVMQARVPWTDRDGNNRINRAFRVQYSSALGPMVGGIRFEKNLNLELVRTIAFLQTMQSSLTGLHLGGSFGGADFDPLSKNSSETRAFCWNYMTEFLEYFDTDKDIACRDMGLGAEGIGYMHSRYKRVKRSFETPFAGKSTLLGGIALSDVAVGFGLVYFTKEMLKRNGFQLAGSRCAISGCGSVALSTAEKLIDCKAKPVMLTDESGILYFEDGVSKRDLRKIKNMRETNNAASLDEFFSVSNTGVFYPTTTNSAKGSQWASKAMSGIEFDYAFPCAVQDEINEVAALQMVNKNGCKGVFEGATMPCKMDAIEIFSHNKVLYAPGIASNAGGIISSWIEVSQNLQRENWSNEDMEAKLKKSMKDIYSTCNEAAKKAGQPHNIALGAYTAAFKRLADAMYQQGSV